MATRCLHALRAPRSAFSFATTTRLASQTIRSRWLATEASLSPSSSSSAASPAVDPQIDRIVDDISGLTLLQAADLVSLLKSRLNIQEIAMPSSVPTPVAAAPTEEVAAEEKPKEKTIFNVMLKSFDAAAKPKIIREVKALVPNLTLIEAKKFVESVPKVLKENLSKEDADKLKSTFEALGGVVVLE